MVPSDQLLLLPVLTQYFDKPTYSIGVPLSNSCARVLSVADYRVFRLWIGWPSRTVSLATKASFQAVSGEMPSASAADS
jgi:hypothetical protein